MGYILEFQPFELVELGQQLLDGGGVLGLDVEGQGQVGEGVPLFPILLFVIITES